ncbi:MAG: domain S-box protein [Solirubrobacteraceae bacterium]|nr:domain S-box protein [Solirubrobacteraceae bacterium]
MGGVADMPTITTGHVCPPRSNPLRVMSLDVRRALPSVIDAISNAGVVITDPALRVQHVEGAIFERHGLDPVEWRGKLISQVLPPGAVTTLGPRYWAAAAGQPQSFDYWSLDGSSAYWVQITPVRDELGEITSIVAVMQEITDRLRVTAELERNEARLRESEHLVGVGSWEIHVTSGAITYSEGLGRLLGLAQDEQLDVDSFLNLVHAEDRASVSASIERCVATGSASVEYRVHRRSDGAERIFAADGVLITDAHGPRYLRGAVLDVTEQRRAERARLEAASLFRQGFDESPIGMALTDAGQGLYVRVNDAMCRLLWRSREDLLERDIGSVTHPEDVALDTEARDAMLAGTLSHFETDKRYLRPDGTLVWARLHVTPVREADGSVRTFFSQIVDISERKAREDKLENDVMDAVWLGRIRDAIDDDRLVLYTQPIVDLTTGRQVQQELLLRMVGEDGTIVAPCDFLPVAERYGLISEIDRWVIRQAVALAATGTATEFNLSGASIGDPDVLREIESALEATGADPALLTIEVTETAIMDEIEAGRVFAERVTSLGCSLALDDFGMGWASLTFLKHFPALHLKIDIDFVRDVTKSEADERLVRGIIGLAKEFRLTTTAEGIEDQETLIKLRELGVDRGQGYFFGRPQPLAGRPAPLVRGAAPRPQAAPDSDAIEVVRTVFEAFAARDVERVIDLFDADGVVRTFSTSALADRDAPYRGHDGLRAYFDDVAQVWDELVMAPSAFREADGAVIVFGQVSARSGERTHAVDVLWVWRLMNGLITSIEVFPSPGR